MVWDWASTTVAELVLDSAAELESLGDTVHLLWRWGWNCLQKGLGSEHQPDSLDLFMLCRASHQLSKLWGFSFCFIACLPAFWVSGAFSLLSRLILALCIWGHLFLPYSIALSLYRAISASLVCVQGSLQDLSQSPCPFPSFWHLFCLLNIFLPPCFPTIIFLLIFVNY